jgi:hypothetical protein
MTKINIWYVHLNLEGLKQLNGIPFFLVIRYPTIMQFDFYKKKCTLSQICCSCTSLLHKKIKYRFYSLLFDPTGTRTHAIPHSRRAHLDIQPSCSLTSTKKNAHYHKYEWQKHEYRKSECSVFVAYYCIIKWQYTASVKSLLVCSPRVWNSVCSGSGASFKCTYKTLICAID